MLMNFLIDFACFLKIAGYVLGGIVLLYIFVRLIAGTKLIVSTSSCNCTEFEADQIYCLPGYSLTLTATATITVERTAKGKPAYTFQKLSIDAKSSIEPDTSNLIAIKYYSNWFSSDDVQFTTSENSLLQNIAITSEDRISSVVAEITKAPQDFLDNLVNMRAIGGLSADSEENEIKEVYEISRIFQIDANHVAKNEIELNWEIPLEVKPDFEENKLEVILKFKNGSNKTTIPPQSFEGIYTRPMSNQLWKMEKIGEQLFPISFTCFGPDSTRLVRVPVRSSLFIKKVQTPKFSNRILIENHIVKPSEVEGFASIPINIFKAIFSIPAQLLQFKIIHAKQETDFETALANLNKARETNAAIQSGKTLKELSKQLELLKKTSKDNQKDIDTDLQSGERPQLGKLSALENESIEQELDLQPRLEFPGDLVLPLAHNWGGVFPESAWKQYDNVNSKTCVPAAAAHLITCWTSNTNPPAVILSLTEVFDALKTVAPLHDIDQGCKMIDFMTYWRKPPGFSRDVLDRFRKFKIRDSQMLKKAVYFFGGCLIGLQLPLSAGMTGAWEFPSGKTESDEINSWGGHTVSVIGYDKNNFIVISWGNVIRMSSSFYEKYNDESYIALSKHWTFPNDKSPTIAQLGFSDLNNLMNTFPVA
jgi:hypothetical protein